MQLPGWDRKSRERFLTAYRAANIGIAVLGLVLLAWLFDHMRSPNWDVVAVAACSLGMSWCKHCRSFSFPRSEPGSKRRRSRPRRPRLSGQPAFSAAGFSTSSRRSPFSFPSRVICPFAAFAIAFQHTFPRFPGYFFLGTITLVYALNAFIVYWLLYRRKRWPLETRAYRMQAVGVQIKIVFYVSIAVTVFFSLIVALVLLHLQRWVPFAVSVYMVVIMLITSMMPFSLRRQAETDRLDPSAVIR